MRRVAFVIAENPAERSWLKREATDFYATKSHVETLAAAAGIDLSRQPLSSDSVAAQGWQKGQCATVGDLHHGWSAHFGLTDLAMVKNLGIEGKVFAGTFAILPEKLAAASAHRRFQPFSLFPATLRDIALVVDQGLLASEVQKTLAKLARAAAGNVFALEAIEVFDVYQGAGLAEGKKSLGFSFVFRSSERTLTDDEVNVVFQKIQDELAKTTPYQIRK
jgi:phenylalanyl-tRNA synthetase beta chain